MTQIESSKLSEKKIKEQLGQIKDRKIETRLSNLRRNNNYNNYNNDNFGRSPIDGFNLPRPQPTPPSPGGLDEAFDPFFGATAPLTSPPTTETSALPYLSEIPPLSDYNTLISEGIAIADTDPNLPETSIRRPVTG